MPVLGRLPGSLHVVDDAPALYAEAARRTLAEADRDRQAHPDIDRLLHRLDNNMDQACRLLAALLNGRNRWLRLIFRHSPDGLADALQASLARVVADTLQRLRGVLPADGSPKP